MITRRRILAAGGAVVCAPAIMRISRAQAAPLRLRLHHFMSPTALGHMRLLVPWAKKVEADSGSRIHIEIYPSMQLGGRPAHLYDQVREGRADIVWTMQGFTPGRFPKTEIFELPFVAGRRALTNARAAQDFYAAHLREEYAQVQPITLFAHDAGIIHAGKTITSLHDMKGLKLRAPTRLGGEALKALGASGVSIPLPQVSDAISQKIVDGCVIPWEILLATRVADVAKFHTDLGSSPTLSSATFLLAMNKAKYEALPADLKKVIDDNSGMSAASAAGQAWDAEAVRVEEMIRSRGNTITMLDGTEAERWRAATAPVIDAWLAEAKAKGLDGETLLKSARALVAKHAAPA